MRQRVPEWIFTSFDAHQCLAMLQFRDRQFAQFELLQTENAFVHRLGKKSTVGMFLVIQRSSAVVAKFFIALRAQIAKHRSLNPVRTRIKQDIP